MMLPDCSALLLPLPPVTKLAVHRYKVPLPSTCISFYSDEGKQIFKEALATRYMQCYFRLAAHFSTQSEPAYCGLATLATALNALEVDPHCVWKGQWRWFDENTFDCCVDLQAALTQGITLDQFVSLAECNGLAVTCHRPPPADVDGEERFRDAVRNAAARDDVLPVVSFSREVLQQTGDGHFSTVAGYSEAHDLVLVLDPARFKYVPYWTPLSLLYEAMKPADSATGLSRGYCLLHKADAITAAQLREAFPAPRQSLSSVKQRICSLLNTALPNSFTSPWCDSIADVIVQSVIASEAAWLQPPALSRLGPGEGGGGGEGSSMPHSEPDRCRCPAAALGPGGWTMLRRSIEQSPVFSLCVDLAQRFRAAAPTQCDLPPQGGGVIAAAAAAAAYCCRAAAHAAAALQPAHRLALLALSWPLGSASWHAAVAVEAVAEKQSCCSADDVLRAMAIESCVQDAVRAPRGYPVLDSVTDLLRTRIDRLLNESISFG